MANTSTLRLRPMKAADLPAVLALEGKCHPKSWPASFFRRLLRSAAASCWVYEQGGAVVGYGVVRCLRERAHVMNLCLAPALRHHGLGRRMLLHLLGIARGRGARRAWLEVFPSNRGAIALYRQLGFRHAFRRRGYYRFAPQGRRDALVMTISLEPDTPRGL